MRVDFREFVTDVHEWLDVEDPGKGSGAIRGRDNSLQGVGLVFSRR